MLSPIFERKSGVWEIECDIGEDKLRPLSPDSCLEWVSIFAGKKGSSAAWNNRVF